MNLTMASIIRAVCLHYGVTEEELKSLRREQRFALPRFMAMYLCREMTTKSLPQIGRAMDRDHTTVLYGIRQAEKIKAAQPDQRLALQQIKRRLKTEAASRVVCAMVYKMPVSEAA